ncbi:Auxin-responsive protein [Quillaja saponaria]|uniref:Auxin-responsive protein n=1 Tax=Quillaja saponaria TaxID=32244 RepID=A0AAD7M1N1_QUISA|nr:Auxin-responsive protein [Quillaja saponaria]
MINPKRLIEIARKWQENVAYKRRRISFPRARSDVNLHYPVANKGHFVVQSSDHKRFVVPLKYLSKNLFKELLRMSEEEFGLPSKGPITLPCDNIFLEYIISLLQGSVSEDLEEALLTSMTTCHNLASSSLGFGQSHQQTIIYGF